MKKEEYKNLVGARLKRVPQWKILLAYILMVIAFCCTADGFMTGGNLVNVLRQSSTEMIVAMGMTFVLLIGGIDLSVGKVAMLAGTITAGLLVKGVPVAVAILVGLAAGVVCGLINGLVVAKLNIPPFITTLAMMNVAEGAALLYCGGKQISGLPDGFKEIGRGYLLGIPVSVWIMLVVIVIWAVVLNKTTYGKRMVAIGGNQDVARLSGIAVTKIKISVYAISGLMAALTGIIYTARFASSQPTLGDGLEMNAIAAAVLGGTSLVGGRGSVLGTVIGTFFLMTMSNGLNLLGVPSFWQMIIKGVLIVVSVILYENLKGKKIKKVKK